MEFWRRQRCFVGKTRIKYQVLSSLQPNNNIKIVFHFFGLWKNRIRIPSVRKCDDSTSRKGIFKPHQQRTHKPHNPHNKKKIEQSDTFFFWKETQLRVSFLFFHSSPLRQPLINFAQTQVKNTPKNKKKKQGIVVIRDQLITYIFCILKVFFDLR